MYDKSAKTKQLSVSHDTVVGDVHPEVASRILQRIPNKPAETMQLHNRLKLSIDLKFDACLNINTSDGLTNEATWVIKHFNLPLSGKANRGILWIEFPEEKVWRPTRRDNRHLYRPRINNTWTPIAPVSRHFTVGRHGNIFFMRTIFPLRHSAVKTLHRALCETLSSVVDFAVSRSKISEVFFQHAHYVGLSQVATLQGLHIRNLNKQISVNENVKQ